MVAFFYLRESRYLFLHETTAQQENFEKYTA